MDKELAIIVLNTAARCQHELADLFPMLKDHWESKDDPIKLAIGSAIYETGLISDKLYGKYPELQADADKRREKYGRAY